MIIDKFIGERWDRYDLSEEQLAAHLVARFGDTLGLDINDDIHNQHKVGHYFFYYRNVPDLDSKLWDLKVFKLSANRKPNDFTLLEKLNHAKVNEYSMVTK
jgi:hypothetical protein